jgi:hypothetical protein
MTGSSMPGYGATDIASALNRSTYQPGGTTTTVSPTGQVTVSQGVGGITQGPLSGLGQIPTGPLAIGGPASYLQWQAAGTPDWYTQWEQRQAADAAAAQAAAAAFPQYAFGG